MRHQILSLAAAGLSRTLQREGKFLLFVAVFAGPLAIVLWGLLLGNLDSTYVLLPASVVASSILALLGVVGLGAACILSQSLYWLKVNDLFYPSSDSYRLRDSDELDSVCSDTANPPPRK